MATRIIPGAGGRPVHAADLAVPHDLRVAQAPSPRAPLAARGLEARVAAPVGPQTATARPGDTRTLRLAEVLEHLQTPSGEALTQRLVAELAGAGVDLRTLRTPGGSRQYTQLLAYVDAHVLPIDPYVVGRFEALRDNALQFPDLERMAVRQRLVLPQPTARFHQVLMVHGYAVLDAELRPDLEYRLRAALPQVVIAALAEAADADGRLSVQRAEQVLGPEGASLVRALAESLGRAEGARAPRVQGTTRGAHAVASSEPVPLPRSTKYTHLSPRSAAMAKLGRSAPEPRDLSARMPVLHELAAHLRADFSRFELVAVQHLFPTTGVLFDVLAEHGVSPQRSSVLGKNYSADPDVMVRLSGQGWGVVGDNIKPGLRHEPGEVMSYLDALPEELRFHADAQIAPVYHRLAQLFDGVDPASTERRFLLLDEGGKLVKLLHQYFPAFAPLCVAVEQTDRGIQEVEKLELRCPVINVARSEAKKRWESPMIGENVVAAALAQLDGLAPGLEPSPKEAVVIGYGAVGKASADALRRRGYTVHVHDTDPAKSAAAERDGCTAHTAREGALAHGHLVISATGRTTLTPADYDLLPRGALLVNAASGNHELGAHLLDEAARTLEEAELAAQPKRGRFDLSPLPDLHAHTVRPYDDGQDRLGGDGRWRTTFGEHTLDLGSAHDDSAMRHRVVRTPAGNEVLLVRGGYVVNLSDDIPPEFIQLTRSLIFAACAQATKATTPGLVALDGGAQDFIVKRMHAHLAKAKLLLAAPDFRKLT